MSDRRKLSFGIKTTQYFRYEDILRTWLEADAIPAIEHAWLFDHPMPIMRADPAGPCGDGWTLLTALAAQTKRLRLGLMVASNANQTPPQLAKRAATVDLVSQGRLEFGIGAGGVEREHTAYGTDYFSPAERVRRLAEACEIIRRMWTERVFDFEGRYYHFKEVYCEPKPVQMPMPPILIGGTGEQLMLRVVAQQADIWNCPGAPHLPIEDYRRKAELVDRYCEEIGRDPTSLVRSVQLIVDCKVDPAMTRQVVQSFIEAGATHIVLGPRSIENGVVQWLHEAVITPLLEVAGTAL